MRNSILLSLGVFILFLTNGCKEDHTTPIEDTPCTITISDVKAVQNGAKITVTWNSNIELEKYIVAYNTLGLDPEYFPNKIEVVGSKSLAVPAEDLNFTPNGLGWFNFIRFFVGGVCSNGTVMWNTSEEAFYFQVREFVWKPRKLEMDLKDYVFSWEDTLENDISSYIVEYGEQGFALGTGTTLNKTATTQFRETLSGFKLRQDTTYDFYVRAISTDGESSVWAGPLTITADRYVNICPVPNNIKFDFKYQNPNYADVTFENYGFKILYWISVAKGDNPNLFNPRQEILTNGQKFSDVILPFGESVPTDFYIRNSCSFGNGDWAGPIPINY